MWVTPITWWVWLTPAHKSWLWNILKSCKLIAKSLVAWNQSKWEYLHHWNGQTLQTGPFSFFPSFFFLSSLFLLFLSFSILYFFFYSFPSFFFLFFKKQLTSTALGGSYREWSEVTTHRASTVAQWERIHLPMQEIQAWSLKDPTCHRAAKPMHHNYWSCAPQPGSQHYWAHVWQLRKPMGAEPMLSNRRSHPSVKLEHRNWRVIPTHQN